MTHRPFPRRHHGTFFSRDRTKKYPRSNRILPDPTSTPIHSFLGSHGHTQIPRVSIADWPDEIPRFQQSETLWLGFLPVVTAADPTLAAMVPVVCALFTIASADYKEKPNPPKRHLNVKKGKRTFGSRKKEPKTVRAQRRPSTTSSTTNTSSVAAATGEKQQYHQHPPVFGRLPAVPWDIIEGVIAVLMQPPVLRPTFERFVQTVCDYVHYVLLDQWFPGNDVDPHTVSERAKVKALDDRGVFGVRPFHDDAPAQRSSFGWGPPKHLAKKMQEARRNREREEERKTVTANTVIVRPLPPTAATSTLQDELALPPLWLRKELNVIYDFSDVPAGIPMNITLPTHSRPLVAGSFLHTAGSSFVHTAGIIFGESLSPLEAVPNFLADFPDLLGGISVDPRCSPTAVSSRFLANSPCRALDLSFLNNTAELGSHFLAGQKNLQTVCLTPLSNLIFIPESFLADCCVLRHVDFTGLDKVEAIGPQFLLNCAGLATVDLTPLGQSLKYVSYSFLSGCTSLTDVPLAPLARITNIPNQFLATCALLKTVDFTPLNKVTRIGDEFLADCVSLGPSVDLQPFQGVTHVGSSFLSNCAALEHLCLTPLSNIHRIHDNFLMGCVRLTNVDFTGLSNVRLIGNHFLFNCGGLPVVDLTCMRRVHTVGPHFLGANDGGVYLAAECGPLIAAADTSQEMITVLPSGLPEERVEQECAVTINEVLALVQNQERKRQREIDDMRVQLQGTVVELRELKRQNVEMKEQLRLRQDNMMDDGSEAQQTQKGIERTADEADLGPAPRTHSSSSSSRYLNWGQTEEEEEEKEDEEEKEKESEPSQMAHVTHPELNGTFHLPIITSGTSVSRITKGTVLEIDVSRLGFVTPFGRPEWTKHARVTNDPDDAGCVHAVLLHHTSTQRHPGSGISSSSSSSHTRQRTSKIPVVPYRSDEDRARTLTASLNQKRREKKGSWKKGFR